MRIWISTIVAAILSGIYWLMFFFVAEGATTSDYRADMQPSQAYLMGKVVAVIVVGVLLYAALIVLWRRLTRSFDGRA